MALGSFVSIKGRLLISLGIALLILLVAFALGLQYTERSELDDEAVDTVQLVEQTIKREIERGVGPMEGLLHEIRDNPQILRAWKRRDRETLYEGSENFFHRLKDFYEITHLYYIEPDKTCFLRVHNPTKHGDVIDRLTINEAHQNKRPSYGVEIGKYGTFTLRVVYPWKENGEVIGYLEVGKEIDRFVPEMARILDVDLILVLHKDQITEENWKIGNEMMGREKGDWNFLKDHLAAVYLTKLSVEKIQGILDHYHEHQGDKKHGWFHHHKQEGDIITVDMRSGGEAYVGGVVPLRDVGNRTVGEMIALQNVTEEISRLNVLTFQVAGVCALVGIILMWIFSKHVGQQERRLIRSREELFRAQEAVEAANRAKSDFLAMMSHDIRTPMNAIMGFTNLLLETPLNEEQKDFLQTIRISGQTLLTLLNDILDYTKIEAGKFQLDQKPFYPVEEARNIVKLQSQVANIKGVSLSCEVASDVPQTMRGDKTRFSQILGNLVSNALKFTDKGSVKIELEMMEESGDKYLRVNVKDSGVGIPPGKFDRLFKPFSQLENDATKRQGTGLGLAISRRLCELMGGDIWVESQVGVGTTFIFTIPVIEAEGKESVEVSASQAVLDLSSKLAEKYPLNILLAEDNVVNQKLAVVLLKKMGYEPHVVENGKAAIDALKEKDYDIVLMDVQMPVIDGLEAAQRIRVGEAGDKNKKIFICAVSALAMQGDKEKCLGMGMNAYIAKPMQFEELGIVLKKAAEKLEKAGKKK